MEKRLVEISSSSNIGWMVQLSQEMIHFYADMVEELTADSKTTIKKIWTSFDGIKVMFFKIKNGRCHHLNRPHMSQNFTSFGQYPTKRHPQEAP